MFVFSVLGVWFDFTRFNTLFALYESVNEEEQFYLAHQALKAKTVEF